MAKTAQKYPLKSDAFTIEGYNDRAKPCPYRDRNCKGQVEPTRNANVGKCNKCGEKFSWFCFK